MSRPCSTPTRASKKHAGVGAKAHPEEAYKILFHRALMMIEHNRFDEAQPVLERLLAKHDGTVFSVWGGRDDARLVDHRLG